MIAQAIIFAVVFIIAAITFKRNKSVSLALFTSNIVGLSFPFMGVNQYAIFGFLVSAVICLIVKKDGELTLIESNGYEINHAISYLYSIRVLCDLAVLRGYAGVEFAWLASMGLLFIQLLLALGDGIGHGKRINNYIRRAWDGSVNAFFQLSRLWH